MTGQLLSNNTYKSVSDSEIDVINADEEEPINLDSIPF